MNFFSKSVLTAICGMALISSCSRPVAYLQPTTREQFKSSQLEPVSVAKPEQPESDKIVDREVSISSAQPAPSVQPIEQTKQMMSQIDTYVRNDNALASNKKLTRRMASINQLLTNAESRSMTAKPSEASQKTTLMQRLMIKKLNKDIKRHLSPERTMVKSVLTIGLIIGIVGLIFLLLSVAPPLGLILLLVGLVLVLVDLIR